MHYRLSEIQIFGENAQPLAESRERKFTISVLKRTSQVVLEVKNLPANTGDARDTGSIRG